MSILTLSPSWQLHSTYFGVPVYRRKVGTGTSGGQWLAMNTTHSSLRSCLETIEKAPEAIRNRYAIQQ